MTTYQTSIHAMIKLTIITINLNGINKLIGEVVALQPRIKGDANSRSLETNVTPDSDAQMLGRQTCR